MGIKINIDKYLSGIMSDRFHRYTSWENCFEAFCVSEKSEMHALHLAFYLASWGMYRGSSGLLQKNHLIHQGAVEILFDYIKNLQCNKTKEIEPKDIENMFSLKNELSEYYSNIEFSKGTDVSKSISPTDTLISKIILGTLGCVPAYDRYFIEGIKLNNFENYSFNKESLHELFHFIEINEVEIYHIQDTIKSNLKKHYPVMKIIDMYFWQLGYDKELNVKKQK